MFSRLGSSLAALALFSGLAAGQTTATGPCDSTFTVDAKPGQLIRMHLRSGDVAITGSEESKITVYCSTKNSGGAREAKVRFKSAAGVADLHVDGGPTNNFRLVVEVPKNSNLVVRCPAGDLTVKGVTGDKDVSLRAGNLGIEVGSKNEYREAEASVLAGDLTAPAFGVDTGGLFRSFRKLYPDGKYLLHAHVTAGEIDLTN